MLAEHLDLRVYGVNAPEYSVSGVNWHPDTNTATWLLPRPLGTDKVLLEVNGGMGGVRNRWSIPLDGDWNNAGDAYPSGDGSRGGNFAMRLNLLPGDVNRDGRVNTLDWLDLRRRYGRSAANPGPAGSPLSYTPFHDLNGDGAITAHDLVMVRRNLLRSLPPGQPASPALLPPRAGDEMSQSVGQGLFSVTSIL